MVRYQLLKGAPVPGSLATVVGVPLRPGLQAPRLVVAPDARGVELLPGRDRLLACREYSILAPAGGLLLGKAVQLRLDVLAAANV